MRETDVTAALLAWYDRNARVMLWRIPPADRAAGVRPDPYHVWLSEIMLQQTTVAAVRDYFRRFLARWPTVQALAGAADADVMAEWAGLGYYARARNLLHCARRVVSDHAGRFPDTAAALQHLPGIGPYTAAAIAAIAFDQAATVVDGNVERVVARLYAVQSPLPGAKAELTRLAAGLTPADRPGDHAQAMMDLGATICTPRRPACVICPLSAHCAGRAGGAPGDLPRKAPKAAKPKRQGIAYVARRADGALLLETRPDRGLLGGMLGWPGGDWTVTVPAETPPFRADWQDAPTGVTHVFTHFALTLRVRVAEVPMTAPPGEGRFVAPHDFRPADLPTLMRKVYGAALPVLDPDG